MIHQQSPTPATFRTAKVIKGIGKGSFGTVHEVVDNRGIKLALKAIKKDENGHGDLMEASIMTTYDHPGLAKAENITIKEKNMYIVQALATSDLSRYTRGKGTQEPVLKSWCNSICQALLCLHNEYIIHCDVKGANILRYPDNTVRLSDFSLTTVMTKRDDMFTQPICTLTHRPPECLIGWPWTSSVDIWSLGCTLYEIATGELLFPYQGDIEGADKMEHEKLKKIVTARTLECILDWLSRQSDPRLGGFYRSPTQVKSYIPAIFNAKWQALSEDFKSLVLSMLKFDTRKRPKIEDVMSSSYLRSLPLWRTGVLSTPMSPIPPQEVRAIEVLISQYRISSTVITKTKEIYSRCLTMVKKRDINLIMGCMWIASKLIDGVPPKVVDYPRDELLNMEECICKHLKFHLHIASLNSIVQRTSNY